MEDKIATNSSHLILRDVPFDGKTKLSYKHRKMGANDTCIFIKVIVVLQNQF